LIICLLGHEKLNLFTFQFSFPRSVKDCKKDLKVKAKAPLTQFLVVVKQTFEEMQHDAGNENIRLQLLHIRDILERWKVSSKRSHGYGPVIFFLRTNCRSFFLDKIVGLNRKLQIKPKKFEEYVDDKGDKKERATAVQLILKFGGNLTKLGEKQAIKLGRKLRTDLYPDNPGGGILRLHSTFRHDLKIKTSDEGRVMKTAAAFAKVRLV
jgi:inositol hexakisphosphate/diphosphoinositol-pentakisphosphate kinase